MAGTEVLCGLTKCRGFPRLVQTGHRSSRGPRCCLETFLVITFGVGDAAGIWWVEVRGPVSLPTVHSTAPPAEKGPRLREPGPGWAGAATGVSHRVK